MSPKPFHATEACIGCKKCEKVCPVGNITVTDRPVWEVTVLNVWLVPCLSGTCSGIWKDDREKRTIQRKVAERFIDTH